MSEPTFEMVDDEHGIKCLLCQNISYHPDDISCLYCSKCGVFHEDAMAEGKKRDREEQTEEAIEAVKGRNSRAEQSRGKANWKPVTTSTRRSYGVSRGVASQGRSAHGLSRGR